MEKNFIYYCDSEISAFTKTKVNSAQLLCDHNHYKYTKDQLQIETIHSKFMTSQDAANLCQFSLTVIDQ